MSHKDETRPIEQENEAIESLDGRLNKKMKKQ